MTQGNFTISTYYSKLWQLWDEFGSLVTLPSCSCDSALKYVEHDQLHKLLQFLMGLNESYIYVKSQILMMSPLPCQSSFLHSFTRGITSFIDCYSCTSFGHPVSAFYSAQRKYNDKKRDTMTCDYCHWNGHTRSTCFKLNGYPPGHKLYKETNNASDQKSKGFKPQGMANMTSNEAITTADTAATTTSGSMFTPEQFAKILQLLDIIKANPSTPTIPEVNMAVGKRGWRFRKSW